MTALASITTPRGAADMVPGGAVIAICGTANVGVPEAFLAALGERYRETGSPAGLTLFFPVEPGHRPGVGIDHLAEPGMISCIIGGSFISTGSGEPARTSRLVLENRVAAYNLPMGVMYLLLRDIAAGRPGHVTDVGLGTFVDPLHGGGRLTTLAKRDLVERVDIGGKPYLRYLPTAIDVAVIRATTADHRGNLTFEDEASAQGMLVMAQAAKASGGLVIAQVQRVLPSGSQSPHDVRVPGMIVDVVVPVAEQEQILDEPFRPALCGGPGADRATLPVPTGLQLPARIAVARVARELGRGDRVNLGYGMGACVPVLHRDEVEALDVQFFVEQGAVGGTPLSGSLFGTSFRPDALMEMPSWFDYLDGGSFAATVLGFGEVDGEGSVNNHHVGKMLPGCGGFIDITARVPRILFCGTFAAGGLCVSYKGGKLTVDREGRHRKFVRRVSSPTLSGPRCIEKGQAVTWFTERAVITLTAEGLEVTEIAPGVSRDDLQRSADCELRFSPDLVEMDTTLFELALEGANAA